MITFLSPSEFFYAFIHDVPGQKEQTILCIFVDFLRPLIKLSNKWPHGVMDWRDASNNKTNRALLHSGAISKSLHPAKPFKYLPTLVKQSGIILYCYNAGNWLSYFPYFLLIPWGWKQGGGGGSDWDLFVHKLPIDSLSSCRKKQLARWDKDLRHVKWLKINKCGYCR